MNEWINVKDKVPKVGDLVLCYNSSKEYKFEGPYFICKFYGNYWDIINDTYPNSSNYSGFTPQRWMPLPEKPNE